MANARLTAIQQRAKEDIERIQKETIEEVEKVCKERDEQIKNILKQKQEKISSRMQLCEKEVEVCLIEHKNGELQKKLDEAEGKLAPYLEAEKLEGEEAIKTIRKLDALQKDPSWGDTPIKK